MYSRLDSLFDFTEKNTGVIADCQLPIADLKAFGKSAFGNRKSAMP
jgi:hypothetical protein